MENIEIMERFSVCYKRKSSKKDTLTLGEMVGSICTPV